LRCRLTLRIHTRGEDRVDDDGIPDVSAAGLRATPRSICPLGDLNALLLQDPTDRPDRAVFGPLLLDEREDQRRRGSSSPAKKTAASRRIAFASRSSRFARSSRRIRSDSLVVTPCRSPASTCACRTQRRSDSVPNPKRAETAPHAAVRLGYSSR